MVTGYFLPFAFCYVIGVFAFRLYCRFFLGFVGFGIFFAELPSRLLLLRSASLLVLLLVFVLDFSGGFLSLMCSEPHQRSRFSLHSSVHLASVGV